MELEITGLAGVMGNLERLGGKKLLDANVARAGRKAMKPVADKFKAAAWEDEGDLKDSITISSRKLRNGNRSIRVGPDTRTVVRADASGAFDFEKKKRPAKYAPILESRDPRLRPIWDAEVEDVEKNFGVDMNKGLERAIRRDAKRRR